MSRESSTYRLNTFRTCAALLIYYQTVIELDILKQSIVNQKIVRENNSIIAENDGFK